jgi:hypothetical protein
MAVYAETYSEIEQLFKFEATFKNVLRPTVTVACDTV